jgi:signal transduction histidine kinase
MMRSLAVKFALAFIAVSLLGIAFVAIFASQVSKREFALFLDSQEQDTLVQDLADLYRSNGGWQGINPRIMRSISRNSPTGGPARTFAVVDSQGKVVIPTIAQPLGKQVTRRELSMGVLIEADGEIVGTLLSPSTRITMMENITATRFSERINQALLWGGLVAIGISLVLGLIFSRTLTRRLGELSRATQAIARGDLDLKVPVTSDDEVGQLSTSFNQMSAELERYRELRRQMTADIAHELRTPLSIILGRAETLVEEMLPPTPEVSRVIYEEAKRINRLVEDLRTLSLSDAGELGLERRPTSIRTLLEEVISVHSPSASQKKVALQLRMADSIPDVHTDPDRIKQVLNNLINNALRHTPENGEIVLSAEAVSQGVEVCVRDSGPGIAPRDLPFVFDRFYRGDKSRRRDKGGSGLGLAIAKSLVHAHGGKISVTSESGKGAAFTLWLPTAT